MKKLNLLVLILSLALFSGLAIGQDSTTKLMTALTGAAEIPGPGDKDGAGTVMLSFSEGKLCYELSVSNIATATGAHLHEAAIDKAGPVIVTFTAPASGSSKDCVAVEADLIARLQQTPENFYVNVHNAEFTNGAIRGQLAKMN
jgi:hypothetical protein